MARVSNQPGWAQRAAGEAVRYLMHADHDGALRCVATLEGHGGGAARVRAVTRVLLDGSADMMRALSARLGVEIAVGVDIRDENGEPLPIDGLDPVVRGALRALLAAAYGDQESREIQLDLACASTDPAAPDLVLTHVLMWTTDLADSCAREGVPVPAWLAA